MLLKGRRKGDKTCSNQDSSGITRSAFTCTIIIPVFCHNTSALLISKLQFGTPVVLSTIPQAARCKIHICIMNLLATIEGIETCRDATFIIAGFHLMNPSIAIEPISSLGAECSLSSCLETAVIDILVQASSLIDISVEVLPVLEMATRNPIGHSMSLQPGNLAFYAPSRSRMFHKDRCKKRTLAIITFTPFQPPFMEHLRRTFAQTKLE